jgi:hypothetical protein
MASVEGAKPRVYLAPSPHGNLESTGSEVGSHADH